LRTGLERLPTILSEHLGTETAAAITEALIKAVMGQKHELEAKGAGSA
jgi:hypothetical protein